MHACSFELELTHHGGFVSHHALSAFEDIFRIIAFVIGKRIPDGFGWRRKPYVLIIFVCIHIPDGGFQDFNDAVEGIAARTVVIPGAIDNGVAALSHRRQDERIGSDDTGIIVKFSGDGELGSGHGSHLLYYCSGFYIL